MNGHPEGNPGGSLLIYHADEGASPIRVLLEGETVWLTQKLLADLYQVGVNTINHHIKGIYEDNELSPEATIRRYRIVQTEGTRQVERLVDHYSLEMILAVGYRMLRSEATVKKYLIVHTEGKGSGLDIAVFGKRDVKTLCSADSRTAYVSK